MLRAQRILRQFPEAYQKEIKLLKKTFADERNGYPPFVLNRWIRQFDRDLQRKPSLAYVPSRLNIHSLFDAHGNQIFSEPTASNVVARERHEASGRVLSTGQVLQGMSEMGTEHMENGTIAERQLERKRDTVDLEQNWVESEDLLQTKDKVPVFLSPFVPGVSEDLKKISKKYELTSWYTYPGRPMDLFTRHRGRQHQSKAQNTVYCTTCSCGCKYIGESNRNLKVRLKEHLHQSSTTAFSAHIKPKKRKQQQIKQTRQLSRHQALLEQQQSQPDVSTSQDSSSAHEPIWKNTVVVATENNNLKRKIMESLCIQSKSASLCNSNLSVSIPAVWGACRAGLEKELVCLD